MKKLFLSLFILLTFFTQSVSAAADFTTVVKSTDGHSVTITIRNDGKQGVDASGSYYSVFDTKITARNSTTGSVDYDGSGPRVAGGETKEVKIVNLDAATAYTITITVDEKSTQKQKTLNATTKASTTPNPNKPPVADPGSSQIITLPQTSVTLEGKAKDADGTIASTKWIKVSGSGTITNPTSLTTTVTGLTEGISKFELIVTDNKGATSISSGVTTISITVKSAVTAAASSSASTSTGDQCHDEKDNQIGDGRDYGYGKDNGDHKADHYGVDTDGDNVIDVEPDPSCFSTTATQETGDDVVSDIIPCTDKCTFTDVFRLFNNFLKFFFTTLLAPLFVCILIYAGFKYITAQGDPSKIVKIKKMLINIIKGIVLILCAWLIVHTIMTTVLNEKFKDAGVEFLGN